MKKIYFVRHGESEGNIGIIRQSANTPLTDHGRKQANFISKRIAKLPIDVVISSTMNRAEETARIVAEKMHKDIELSSLFVERRRPSEQLGKPKDDPAVLAIQKLTEENFLNPDYHYSDEENILDLKERAVKALQFLAKRPENNILVVTHGYFMRVVIASVVFGKDITLQECKRFIDTFRMENTGITVLSYKEWEQNPWMVRIWNDHAHLADLED